MLSHILCNEPYALALSPGFFRFYCYVGVLEALDSKNCMKLTHVSGSSAGAMVGAFVAAGQKPLDVIDILLNLDRKDYWDVGVGFGLLKGQLFQDLIDKHLPVKTFEECIIPFGCTAYDILRFRTNCVTTGKLASTVVASCTFPGLFQPVMIDGYPHIDGGVWDHAGLMAMPISDDELATIKSIIDSNQVTEDNTGCDNPLDIIEPSSDLTIHANGDGTNGISSDTTCSPSHFKKLIVNIICDRSSLSSSVLPERLRTTCKLLTIIMENIPMVNPYNMKTMGPVAYQIARKAVLKALESSSHMQELAPDHWCCYIDGDSVQDDEDVLKARELNSTTATMTSSNQEETVITQSSSEELPVPTLSRVPSFSFIKGSYYVYDSLSSTITSIAQGINQNILSQDQLTSVTSSEDITIDNISSSDLIGKRKAETEPIDHIDNKR